MKPETNPERQPDGGTRGPANHRLDAGHLAHGRLTARDLFAILFGLFLGLSLLKFGNPVILDDKVVAPASCSDAWSAAWPPHWGLLLLVPLTFAGAYAAIPDKRRGSSALWLLAVPVVWLGWQFVCASQSAGRQGTAFTLWPPQQVFLLLASLALAVVYAGIKSSPRWPGSRWLWVLPVTWFAWQLVSGTQTVDRQLTTFALWQFAGCLVCYLFGAFLMGFERGVRWLLIGLLAAFAFCLVRAAVQWRFEFPQERQMLVEGERAGWTNIPPKLFLQLKQDGVIVATNGMEVINPVFLAKYEKRRVHGTLVYPNALAGAVLLLLPVSLVLAFNGTRRFRLATRVAVITLTCFLGFGGLFWTSSKSGWLIAAAVGGVWLLSFKWPAAAKLGLIFMLGAASLVGFGVRFHSYFASGATSVGARFDYWRAAVEITREHPVLGSGPGTFQRPYALVKPPNAEMARLTHNDYLEQFSDSGIVGGASYLAWIGLLLVTLGKRIWRMEDPLCFGIFLGILGWFVQGFSEFSLYVPALSWTAFALSGCLLGLTANEFDNRTTRR